MLEELELEKQNRFYAHYKTLKSLYLRHSLYMKGGSQETLQLHEDSWYFQEDIYYLHRDEQNKLHDTFGFSLKIYTELKGRVCKKGSRHRKTNVISKIGHAGGTRHPTTRKRWHCKKCINVRKAIFDNNDIPAPPTHYHLLSPYLNLTFVFKGTQIAGESNYFLEWTKLDFGHRNLDILQDA